MPSPATTDLPRPKSWDEFEDIVTDVLKMRWKTPNVTRNGRSGQGQNGVDICGRAVHLENRYAGAQCKRLAEAITWKTIEDAVVDADGFEPPLAEFYVATTASRDVDIQRRARLLSDARQREGKCPVEVLFWEDLCLDLVGEKQLLAKFFPNWSKLHENEQVPEIKLLWLEADGTEVTGPLMIESSPPSAIDFDSVFEPFAQEEIDHLRAVSPDDVALALKYNDDVARMRNDLETKTAWFASRARERFDKGRRYGVAIAVDRVEARDIVVTVAFPPELEIFAAASRPEKISPPELPRAPDLAIHSAIIDHDATLDVLRKFHARFPFEGFALPLTEPRRLLTPPRADPIRIKHNRVQIKIRRLAQRRRISYLDDNDAIVIASTVGEGTFSAQWRIDAVNFPAAVEGTVDIVVTRNERGRGLRRPYVGPDIEVIRSDDW